MNRIHMNSVMYKFIVVIGLHIYKTALQKFEQKENMGFKILIEVSLVSKTSQVLVKMHILYVYEAYVYTYTNQTST